MLPKNPEETAPTTHTIYINPNFNRPRVTTPATHINPNFLLPRTNAVIHLNPNFLQQKLTGQQHLPQVLQAPQVHVNIIQPNITLNTFPPVANVAETQMLDVTRSNSIPGPSCKLITKSRMRIVRETKRNPPVKVVTTDSNTYSPMMKIGRCKLLRRNLLKTVPRIKETNLISSNKYKIDRRRIRSTTARCNAPMEKPRRRSFVTRFSLRRCTSVINKRKLNLSSPRKATFKPSIISKNRNLHTLNINGVLYKSTRNKLQRKDIPQTSIPVQMPNQSKLKTPTPPTTKASLGRTVIVRGTRFMMDKEGFKLTRMPDENTTKLPAFNRSKNIRRIDIGGLTYVATSKNVLVRTGNHIARLHVHNAKQKSVHILTRCLVKSNIPCAIFQHLGKCAAFERGKCHKVHDKRQVVICSRFLRGNCENPTCLLSHNVSLTKMPVCKFFLQGVCVRTDCPYLHKKVGKNTEICNDFLRGYCKLAEKCNKRHEFLCPDYERYGKCEKISCIYCKKKKQVHKVQKPMPKPEPTTETEVSKESQNLPIKRYFAEESGTEDTEDIKGKQTTELSIEDSCAKNPYDNDYSDADDHQLEVVHKPSRPKLGSLPSYIPLS